MKSFALVSLLLLHGLTQFGISLADQTWKPWMRIDFPQSTAACTILLFAVRMAADLGLCFWIIGPSRLRESGHWLASWVVRTEKSSAPHSS